MARLSGDSLVVRDPAGCILPESVGDKWTPLSPLAPGNEGGVGWGGRLVLPKLARSTLWLGKVAYAQHCSQPLLQP